MISLSLILNSEETSSKYYLESNKEIKESVDKRRGKTKLSKLAASMKPGTWAELKTEMPKKLWTSPPPSRGLHIAGWTDDAHWDSRTGQFLYMGLRQTRQFIIYSEEKNAWRVIKLDPRSDNPVFRTNTGHIYETNGFDHKRSRFYHYYRSFKNEKDKLDLKGGISYFDTLTEKWTKLPAGPGSMSLEYFDAMDGLVVLGKETKFFSNKKQKWESLGVSPVDGYHSLMRHNPYRNEILMGGGNHNKRVVARIKKNGKIERLKDFPGDFGLSPDKVTIDPTSGRYLMFTFKNGPMKCLEFDSNENEYRLVKNASFGPYPYKKYAAPYSVCAFVPEYGVVMWGEPRGVFLYKHDSSIKYPIYKEEKKPVDLKKKEKK